MMISRYYLRNLKTPLLFIILLSVLPGVSSAIDIKEADRAIRLREFDLASQILQTLAHSGAADAQYKLAGLLSSGRGIDKNALEAHKWYLKAALQGHAKAQFNLAYSLENGMSGIQDQSAAMHWYRKAADQGHAQATRKIKLFANSSAPTGLRSGENRRFLDAIRNSYTKLITLSLDNGADINATDHMGNFALEKAVAKGNLSVMNTLFEHMESSSLSEAHKTAAFLAASKSPQLPAIKQLLAHGFDVNVFDENGNTALIYAAAEGHTEVVKFLLEQTDIALLHKNKSAQTAYDIARRKKHNKISAILQAGNNLGALASKGEDSNSNNAIMDQYLNWPALVVAATRNQPELLEQELARKVNVNIEDPSGLTALDHAVLNSHKDMVVRLIKANAETDRVDGQGNTAICQSSKSNSTDILNLILQSDANINQQDARGNTAILCATQHGNTAMVDTLLRQNANIDLQSQDGTTALIAASNIGNIALFETIMTANPVIDRKDRLNRTAVWYAVENGFLEITNKLLEKAGPINHIFDRGHTLLMRAAIGGNQELVSVIMQKYGDVNIRSDIGNTALTFAASNGHIKIVGRLISQSAGMDNQNSSGNTALMLAAQNGHSDVVDLLLQSGADAQIRNKHRKRAIDLARKSDNKRIENTLESKDLKGNWLRLFN